MTPARLPIGPDGAEVDVAVDQAIVTVPQPAPATQFALVAEPVVHGLATLALGAIGAAFQIGERLQRDVAGLV